MSPKAAAAWEIYRDLGPKRSLRKTAEAMGNPGGVSSLERWSAKYSWVAKAAAHDHRRVKEDLGKRVVLREANLQKLSECADEAVDRIMGIIRNRDMVPVMNRQGEQIGEKPAVPFSTVLEASKLVLGITGIVPVKRLELSESKETTDEKLDKMLADLPKEKILKIQELLSGDSSDGSGS